jgi:methylated-DNA-[protein]-cysteine S-methyltransferase
VTGGTIRLPLDSPIGPLSVSLSERAVHRLDFGESPELEVPRPLRPLLGRLTAQLAEYFAGERAAFDLPLEPDPPGTPFQEDIWRALREIPYGQVLSYADLASWAGHPGAFRAAGAACGSNRIAIVIPCHRVVAKGGLGGFGGGPAVKETLLRLEREHRPHT